MILGQLLAGIEAEASPAARAARVTGVTCDSRQVAPGSLFVAVRGARFDGHDFLPAAARAGAAAALVERRPADPRLPFARVPDTRAAAGVVAAAFHGNPADSMRLVGVTGTNGKTTVAWLLDEVLWRGSGASLCCGTLGHRVRRGRGSFAPGGAGLTTREAPEFQALLAAARAAGCVSGAVECSSHGLVQGRLRGASFRVAVFTNLTQDHLDFHEDLEAYFEAKRILFTDLLRPGGVAVIGLDDRFGARLARDLAATRPEVRIVGFGVRRGAAVRITGLRAALDGTRARLETAAGSHEIASPMLGGFSALNLAAAFGALVALGLDGARAAGALSKVPAPPGRMERIRAPGKAPAVIVDYAHTPAALARSLAYARELAGTGRLLVVFGCGGDRDRGKRALMGDVAARLADLVVLTSDNPRTEDPEAIIADIRKGAENPALGAAIVVEPDRRRAIGEAVAAAALHDIVFVAGRGHERRQDRGGVLVPLDDRAVAKEALGARRRGR